MFSLRLRPLNTARRRTRSLAGHHLHTTRALAADFASYGKPATGGTNPDGDVSTEKTTTYTYTKQQDVMPEPRVSHIGTRTYVVSPKDSASYGVPGGAYGSSDPYLTPPPMPPPQTSAPASTATGPAHPNTAARVPHHTAGVGESAAVRFRTAPGVMHTHGGSDGGIDLMDMSEKDSTHTVAQHNLPPNDEAGRLGNTDAWKFRK